MHRSVAGTKVKNIYDLVGNDWKWTQERDASGSWVLRGGYNLLGAPCPGYLYPAAVCDALPGNDHRPDVAFRTALYVE